MSRARLLSSAVAATLLPLTAALPGAAVAASGGVDRAASGAGYGEAWVRVPGVDSDHDGRDDRVAVRWTLPEGVTGPVPVVVEPSPYYDGLRPARNHDVDVDGLYVPGAEPGSTYQRWLLRRGFAYVEADSLGSGRSTGCPTAGGANETAGMVAVVRWLTGELPARNRRDRLVDATWSTGRVGMIGVSYNGTLANAAASTGVAGLDAVVAISAISSWYDYYRSQGSVRAPGGYQGEDADVLARAVLTRDRPGACRDELRWLRRHEARRSGDLTRFWRRRDYRSDANQVTAGVLTLHGTADDNVFSDQAGRWLTALSASPAPERAWWHGEGHGDWLAWNGNREWRRAVVAWFDHFLRDAPNGVLDMAASTVVDRRGRLRTQDTWPQGSPAHLYPGSVRSHRGRLRTTRSNDRGRIVDDAGFGLRRLATKGPERSRLLWRSRPLSHPIELSGLGSVDVEVSVDAPAANLSVGLLVIGRRSTRLLAAGWADAQNHESLAHGVALVPGDRYQVRVDLDQVLVDRIPAGRRLGLVVASSDRGHTLRPPRGTRVTVHTAGTGLELPVVGGADALATALGPPVG